MLDRRAFVTWLLATPARPLHLGSPPPSVDVRPSALYQAPDGRRNLVRVTVAGLDAPAARARVTDRRGALVGTAGLLPPPAGLTLAGEVWVPLPGPAEFQIDIEVGRARVARHRVRLTPPRRWTVYCLSSIRTDVGYTDLQERALETHRQNLDAAVARLATLPEFRWTAECALQVLSYVENRGAADAAALLGAIRDGRIGFQALFANLLTGLLDHETFARVAWPAGLLAREHGLGFVAAQITGVPGQTLSFPMVLAASGVRYLASAPSPERALPLLPAADAERLGLAGEWTSYPQLYYWEGPDGSRVLHWRAQHYGEATRLGLADGPDAMGRRLSDWLQGHPGFAAAAWPYDVALLYGLDARDNAAVREELVASLEEFRRRFAFPRLVPGRAEDCFRELERRHGAKIPVRRGDTGLYWEDGAVSTAAELALFREAQLAARAAELLALWDDRLEPPDAGGAERRARRAAERRTLWRDLLLFGEHTWGAEASVAAPDARQTVAQWEYKRRFVLGAAAAARELVAEGLLRLGRATEPGPGRLVFNAASWERTDVVAIPGGAGRALIQAGRELPSVDLADGSALAVVREVPGLGYVALGERERPPRAVVAEGEGLEAQAGGFRVRLDPATGAVASLTGPDGVERVQASSPWSGLNQLVHVSGGARSALWTSPDRADLTRAPELDLRLAELVGVRRERLPGIGVRLVAERRLRGLTRATSTVTLYDELPWVDLENRLAKVPTLEKEALYVAFPFAFTRPAVEIEVPLGRMRVEHDQQPGSCRDWFCHAHWVWLTEGTDGLLWSGPDTPLLTLNDVFRGAWRRRIEPDGTLFAYAMHNYWPTNFAARQGGEHRLRYRLSPLAPGDAAEPVRRGWAACDALYVSARYENAGTGPLLARDRALIVGDRGVLVVGAKPADDGEGAVVKLLDVTGATRTVSVWPGAFAFQLARRASLVEMNEEPLPVGADRRVSLELTGWGVAAARLWTPRESAG